MKRLIIAAGVVALSAHSALAASIDIGQAFGNSLTEIVGTVIMAAISTLIGWVLMIAKNKFNIDIEAKHREALTAFLQRQASALVARGAVHLAGLSIEVKSEELAAATNAAFAAIPDALKFFGLTPERVAKMIVDFLPRHEAVAQAQAVALDVHNPATSSR